FERGSSAPKTGGLGLGLYIVSKIVEAHHGKIRVDSKPGLGSTFVVELPLRPLQPTASRDPDPRSARAPRQSFGQARRSGVGGGPSTTGWRALGLRSGRAGSSGPLGRALPRPRPGRTPGNRVCPVRSEQRLVQLRAAIAKEPEGGPIASRLVQVQRRGN